jgi:hypothetical protein
MPQRKINDALYGATGGKAEVGSKRMFAMNTPQLELVCGLQFTKFGYGGQVLELAKRKVGDVQAPPEQPFCPSLDVRHVSRAVSCIDRQSWL